MCVYKVDNKGRFNAICPYRRPAAGALTHAVFRTVEQKKALVKSAFAAADTPPCYYGGETGVICMGDDLGRSSDVIPSLGGAVAAMLYLVERDTLVVITRASVLCTFKLTDNKPVQARSLRPSVPTWLAAHRASDLPPTAPALAARQVQAVGGQGRHRRRLVVRHRPPRVRLIRPGRPSQRHPRRRGQLRAAAGRRAGHGGQAG